MGYGLSRPRLPASGYLEENQLLTGLAAQNFGQIFVRWRWRGVRGLDACSSDHEIPRFDGNSLDMSAARSTLRRLLVRMTTVNVVFEVGFSEEDVVRTALAQGDAQHIERDAAQFTIGDSIEDRVSGSVIRSQDILRTSMVVDLHDDLLRLGMGSDEPISADRDLAFRKVEEIGVARYVVHRSAPIVKKPATVLASSGYRGTVEVKSHRSFAVAARDRVSRGCGSRSVDW